MRARDQIAYKIFTAEAGTDLYELKEFAITLFLSVGVLVAEEDDEPAVGVFNLKPTGQKLPAPADWKRLEQMELKSPNDTADEWACFICRMKVAVAAWVDEQAEHKCLCGSCVRHLKEHAEEWRADLTGGHCFTGLMQDKQGYDVLTQVLNMMIENKWSCRYNLLTNQLPEPVQLPQDVLEDISVNEMAIVLAACHGLGLLQDNVATSEKPKGYKFQAQVAKYQKDLLTGSKEQPGAYFQFTLDVLQDAIKWLTEAAKGKASSRPSVVDVETATSVQARVKKLLEGMCEQDCSHNRSDHVHDVFVQLASGRGGLILVGGPWSKTKTHQDMSGNCLEHAPNQEMQS